MRKTLIGAAAAATVAVTGLAFAQEPQSGQEQKPAAGQMEKRQAGERATGHEGAAAQAQGQTGDEHQRQGGKMDVNEGAGAATGQLQGEAETHRQGEAGAKQNGQREGQAGGMQKGQREGQAGMQNNQRQGEARSNETERGANAKENGKAAEGQTRMKGAPDGQRAGETERTEKGQAAQTERRAQGAQGEERTGAAQPNREGAGQAGQTATSGNREGAAQEGQTATSGNREGMTREGQTSTAGGTNARGGAGTVEARGNAHLSNQQASRIADTLWSTASPAQTSVNINIDVGEPLPGNVELMPLPPAVVSIVPEYRGYEYVVVHDAIVIIQPSTRKVVEVIRRGGAEHAMREGGGRGHRLTLSEQQQRLIRETVRRQHIREAPIQEQLTYGVTVPEEVTLEPVPQPLVAEIPMIEQYRMFVANGDHIVLVDPDTREVVDVID